mmetsp:Transcript_107531/g.342939  ORF Transcript_107531/g.342939 Transcript_107531/m.342939 type:complete len:289 (+) Transcript_107531:629-1495(+)
MDALDMPFLFIFAHEVLLRRPDQDGHVHHGPARRTVDPHTDCEDAQEPGIQDFGEGDLRRVGRRWCTRGLAQLLKQLLGDQALQRPDVSVLHIEQLRDHAESLWCAGPELIGIPRARERELHRPQVDVEDRMPERQEQDVHQLADFLLDEHHWLPLGAAAAAACAAIGGGRGLGGGRRRRRWRRALVRRGRPQPRQWQGVAEEPTAAPESSAIIEGPGGGVRQRQQRRHKCCCCEGLKQLHSRLRCWPSRCHHKSQSKCRRRAPNSQHRRMLRAPSARGKPRPSSTFA